MADYYSILKKTISGLPANTAPNRRVVYERARQAIDRQLRSMNPPPTEEAIAHQMMALGKAIEQMEREYIAAGSAPGASAPVSPPDAAAPRQARQPAPAMPASRPLAGSAPAGPGAALPGQTGQTGQTGLGPRGAGPSRREPAIEAPEMQRPAAGRAPPPVAGGAPRAGTPAYDDSLEALDRFDPVIGDEQRQSRQGGEDRPRGSSRLVSLLIALVVLGLIGLGGYALWTNREPLMAAIDLDKLLGRGQGADKPPVAEQAPAPQRQQAEQPPRPPVREAPPAQEPPVRQPPARQETARQTPPPEPPAGGKEDVRLSQDGETVPGSAETPPTPPARQAGEPPTRPEAPPQREPTVNPVDQEGETVAAEDETEDSAPPATGQNALPAIAQKAYLYEEGSAGSSASRDNAAIVWSLENEVLAEGRPPEAVIHGKFDVPGRGLVMNVVIKRNLDEALPASHIIELAFESPPDFSGGNIDNVARFVMKSSEQARGEGLIAVPAKIDTGYFLIALNNLAQAIETNRKLLLESTWIDIPVGYTSGRRALVTLEKGAIGDKVFRDAFADWDAR